MSLEICILPFFGQGHLFPCMELCNHLTCRNFQINLLIPSTFFTSVPSSLRQHPLFQITLLPSRPPPGDHDTERAKALQNILSDNNRPTMEEYNELAQALESCEKPFIWVLQPGSGKPGPPQETEKGYFPDGLENRVGNRGLIIRGWAPQILILSHQSTGGFLSHCSWNSTMEAIGRGIPLLAWPIRGDQYFDAKLVVSHLRVGYMVSNDLSEKIIKEDIVKGIERLMGDEEMKKMAEVLSVKFRDGFPTSSVAALDAFKDYVNHTFV